MRPLTTIELAVISALCAGLFVDVTEAVLRSSAVGRADYRISLDLLEHQWQPLRHLAIALSYLGSPAVVATLLVTATVGFVLRRDAVRAVLMPATSILVLVLGQQLRRRIGRGGPTGGSHLHVPGVLGSYPSGHVLGVGLAFAALAMAARSRAVSALGLGLVLLSAASRVYLFAHFPTDVIASLLAVGAVTAAVEAVGTATGARWPGRLGGTR